MATTDTTKEGTQSTATRTRRRITGEPRADRIEVRNPATGDTITSVPAHPAEHVREVVRGVREAQPAWEALGPEGRYRHLADWRDWMFDNGERIADILQAETGKVRQDAGLEIPTVADEINFYGENAARFLADEIVRAHAPLMKSKALKVVYRPYPVVGVIAPWNFPVILGLCDAIPALCAGCAVVIKPSEFTPLSLLEIVRGWQEEVGGPPVIDAVTGAGETGSAFTGSVATGKKVMARAAETLTPVSLEMGGKDPMVVLSDADLERAANAAAWGGVMNSGQICISVERVYAEEAVHDQFVSKLTDKVAALRQGRDEPAYTKDVGAMTSPNQIEIVEEHVRDAVEHGAKVLIGGKRGEGPGDYFEPTVLVDVDHSMKIMREETFGPVIPVMKVRDADEAVRLANDSTYGLMSSVFGERSRAEAVARRLEVGACTVNDVLTAYLTNDVPMSGWKNSGVGGRHGVHAVRKYCRTESILVSRLAPKNEALWFPYSPRKGRLVARLMRFVNARGLRARLGLPRR
jgi:acyl-CoA reductase-like NAD-dependent aldehyde dehydrogenase